MLQAKSLGGAAPRPVLCMRDEPERHRPSLHERTLIDHVAAREEFANDGRDGRDPVRRSRGAAKAGSAYPAHERIERPRSPRGHHEMKGAGNEAEREQVNRSGLELVVQLPQKVAIIRRPA